jgi:hypothetical protein
VVSIATALVIVGSVGCCRAFHRRHCVPCSNGDAETVSLYPGGEEATVIEPEEVELDTVPDSAFKALPDRPKSSTAHDAPKLEPTPPPRKTQPEVPPTPSLKPTPKEPPTTELVPKKPALPDKPDLKPGALRLNVEGSKASIAVGEELEYTIVIENTGDAIIASVELAIKFSSQLQPLKLREESAGKIQGNTVALAPIANFKPMPLTFHITAKGVEAGSGRVTVEAKSPILTAGPLTQQVATRIVRM